MKNWLFRKIEGSNTKMKKTFKMEDLDCANCAAKMEAAIQKLPEVNGANISFMRQQITLDAPDDKFDDVLKKVQKTIKKIEPDARILV